MQHDAGIVAVARAPGGASARSSTARVRRVTTWVASTLDLLDWDHALEQQDMLPERKFAEEARARGLELDAARLESLHRQRILVPFYAIRYSAAAVATRARADGTRFTQREMEQVLRSVSVSRESLFAERRVGDLSDPALAGYRPWSIHGSNRGIEYPRRRYLYSPYQLIGLRQLLDLCPTGDPIALERSPHRGQWASIRRHLRALGGTYRQTAVLLSLLESAYRPEVYPTLSGFDLDPAAWSEYRRRFDPKAVLDGVDVAPNDVADRAQRILSGAHAFDPLAQWSSLVALTHHSHWYRLKGLARLAIDYRIAAEMLLLCHQELAERGLVPALEKPGVNLWSPFDYRITNERHRLDLTLTHFGLSPHPSVLVVIEGKTEAMVLTRLLDGRLKPGWRNAILLLDAEGVDADVKAVAAVVAPQRGPDEGEYVLLSRPPTSILVVADPEGPFASPEQRENVRKGWVARIARALPAELQTATVLEDLQHLVEVQVWDEQGSSFEFAHFTDRALAEAILATSPRAAPSLDELVAAVAECRSRRGNLKSVWRQWDPPHPTKVRIAEHLQESLAARVNRSLDMEEDPPSVPMARIMLQVIRLSLQRPRHHQFVLRRQKPSDEE